MELLVVLVRKNKYKETATRCLNWNLEFTISLDYMTIYFATIPLSTPSNQESSYCISY